MFEWAPVIPILDETLEEAPDMINEDELDVEDVEIHYDDKGQEEDEYEKGLNIIEENQYPVNEEGISITKEEDNNEVENTDIENNKDGNLVNEKNDVISAAEENDLGKDAIQSEDREQSEESK